MSTAELDRSIEKNDSFGYRVYLASPRGFCAGVERAIDGMWEWLSAHPNETLYAYHEIVHNTQIVDLFKSTGRVIFIKDLSDVPEGAKNLMVSAHGASPEIFEQASQMGLNVIDATCPLVIKVHNEARTYANLGMPMAFVAHPGHDEAIGTMGYAPGFINLVSSVEAVEELKLGMDVALIQQTTLSQDESREIVGALKRRYPNLQEPKRSDICYATQNRQDAVKGTIERIKGEGIESVAVVVVGSPHSSNSNRLREVAEAHLKALGIRGFAIMVDGVTELAGRVGEFNVEAVMLTSGASVSEATFHEVAQKFVIAGSAKPQNVIVKEERMQFAKINV